MQRSPDDLGRRTIAANAVHSKHQASNFVWQNGKKTHDSGRAPNEYGMNRGALNKMVEHVAW